MYVVVPYMSCISYLRVCDGRYFAALGGARGTGTRAGPWARAW
ncbi:hypothetical protein ACFXD5_10420 [Streptomyces sp. NPDC059385]